MSKIVGSQPRISTLRLASVVAAANALILADTALDAEDVTVVEVFAGQPDVARNITVKGNDANVAGDVTISGVNAAGEAISETLALAGAAEVAGAKAFARVTLVDLPPYDTADTERIRVGVGSKLGLPVALDRNTVIAAFRDGARETTAPTVAVSAGAVESNTVTLNSALNGTDVVIDFYETH